MREDIPPAVRTRRCENRVLEEGLNAGADDLKESVPLEIKADFHAAVADFRNADRNPISREFGVFFCPPCAELMLYAGCGCSICHSIFPPVVMPGPLPPGMDEPYEKICESVNTFLLLTYYFFPSIVRKPKIGLKRRWPCNTTKSAFAAPKNNTKL